MRLYDKIIRMCGTADFIKGLNYKANKVKLIKTEDEDYYRRAYFNVTSERIDKNYKVEKEPIENSELLIDLMVLCNDSKFDPQDKENLIGDPTETALFKYAMDMGYNPQNIVN